MMIEYLDQLDSFVWGPPLLILLVGTGIMLTIRLGGIQLLKLPHALKLIFKKSNQVRAIFHHLERFVPL